jgi:hypothetical protein
MSCTIAPEAVPGKVCSGFPSGLVKNKELERFRENALETAIQVEAMPREFAASCAR